MERFLELATGETYLTNEDFMARTGNTTFIYRRGTDAVLRFRLLDETREGVPLAGCEARIRIGRRNQPAIIDEPCEIAANQLFDAGRGRGSFQFDAATTGQIARGEYQVEIHVTDAENRLLVYPATQRNQTGKLIVQD